MEDNKYYQISVGNCGSMVNDLFISGKYTDLPMAKLEFFNLCILLLHRNHTFIELMEISRTEKNVVYLINNINDTTTKK